MDTIKTLAERAGSLRKEAPKQDLLLRLFESDFFSEFMCLQYLFQNNDAGVQDYLCKKLYEMPEAAVEKYLLQFVYLAISRPGSTLERTIVAWCRKSFVVALKVHWLLLALSQDQPKARHVEALREKCEQAALDGDWAVPFRTTKLDPLSPQPSGVHADSGYPASPVLSPLTQPPANVIMGSSPLQHPQLLPHLHLDLSGHAGLAAPGILNKIDEGAEGMGVLSPDSCTPPGSSQPLASSTDAEAQPGSSSKGDYLPCDGHGPEQGESARAGSSEGASTSGAVRASQPEPLAQRGSGGLSVDLGCLREPEQRGLTLTSLGGAAIGPPAAGTPPVPSNLAAHISHIRAELGDGEGVTALLRRSTASGRGVVAVAEPVATPVSEGHGQGGEAAGCLSDDDVAGGMPAASPMSPKSKLRHETYNATLDFLEALCDASSSLVSISQEERHRALRYALEALNKQLDRLLRREVAVWFPMGLRHDERVLRLVAREATLLTSRERAPFMLFVEVLESGAGEEEEEAGGEAGSSQEEGCEQAGEAGGSKPRASNPGTATTCAAPPSIPQSPHASLVPQGAAASMCGDSAVSLMGSASVSSAVDSAFAADMSGPGAGGLPQAGRSVSQTGAPGSGSASGSGSGDQVSDSQGPPSPSPSTTQLPHAHIPASSPIAAAAYADMSVPDRTTSLPQPAAGAGESAPPAGSASVGPQSRAAASHSLPTGPMVIPQRRRHTSTLPGEAGPSDGGAHHLLGSALGTTTGGIAHAAAAAAAAAAGAITPPPAAAAAPRRSLPGGELSGSGGLSGVVRSLCFAEPSVVLPELPSHPHAGVPAGSTGGWEHPGGSRLARPAGAAIAPRGNAPLSEAELAELIQAGCLSPPGSAGGSSGPAGTSSVMHQMGAMMASLRGEAPLVRLRIQVLEQPGTSAEGAGPAAGPAPSEAVASTEGDAAQDGEDGSGSSLLSSAKAMSLLHKFGLCARPPMPARGDAARRGDRLVAVSLEVAGGVNLSIASPYRKSRRTPSHEAISLVAHKLKIHAIPPPLESGPPLGPPAPSFTAKQARGQGTASDDGRAHAAAATGVESCHGSGSTLPTAAHSFTTGAEVRSLESGSWVAGTSAAEDKAQDPAAASGLPTPFLSFPTLSRALGSHAPGTHSAPSASPVLKQPLTSADCAAAAATAAAAGNFGSLLLPGGVVSAAAAAAARTPSPSRPESHASGGVSPPAGSSPTRSRASTAGSVPSTASGFSLLRSLQSAGQQLSALAHSLTAGSSAAPTAVIEAVNAANAGMPRSSSMLGLATGGAAVSAARAIPQPRSAREERGERAREGEGGAGPGPGSSALTFAKQFGPDGRHRRSLSATAGSLSALSGVGGGGSVAGSLLSRAMAPPPPLLSPATKLDAATEAARRDAWAVYGERWADKVARIRRESPHGRRKGWALRCVIVKTGDDCRQELLAVQLVRTFADIFSEAGLPLWVRTYDVLVTSSRTAFIEVVTDALSIHTVKARSPPTASFSDHFFAKWPRGSPECVAAQRAFTESLAAYSIICYLLQIKDRHNGNVLVDDAGRLVHIDFGFMLSNSPGGVNFEAAPFKLTRELLEVMDSNSEGRPSELFDYFKVLVIQGFLACRKHHDRLVTLVRVMGRSGLPCFKAGDRAVKALEKRFALQLTEVACVQHVLGLISDSLDAWRTRQYDYYQRLLNGIL